MIPTALCGILAVGSFLTASVPGVAGNPDVTLYHVVEELELQIPAPTGGRVYHKPEYQTLNVHSIGTAEDGKTIYEQEVIVTQDVLLGEGFTSTISPESGSPIPGFEGTATFIYAQDASGMGMTSSWSRGENTVIQQKNCEFEGTTRGSCVRVVEEIHYDTRGWLSHTTTYSGSLAAYATLTTESTPIETVQTSDALTGWRLSGYAVTFVGVALVWTFLV